MTTFKVFLHYLKRPIFLFRLLIYYYYLFRVGGTNKNERCLSCVSYEIILFSRYKIEISYAQSIKMETLLINASILVKRPMQNVSVMPRLCHRFQSTNRYYGVVRTLLMLCIRHNLA